jgi:hypothetical protein
VDSQVVWERSNTDGRLKARITKYGAGYGVELGLLERRPGFGYNQNNITEVLYIKTLEVDLSKLICAVDSWCSAVAKLSLADGYNYLKCRDSVYPQLEFEFDSSVICHWNEVTEHNDVLCTANAAAFKMILEDYSDRYPKEQFEFDGAVAYVINFLNWDSSNYGINWPYIYLIIDTLEKIHENYAVLDEDIYTDVEREYAEYVIDGYMKEFKWDLPLVEKEIEEARKIIADFVWESLAEDVSTVEVEDALYEARLLHKCAYCDGNNHKPAVSQVQHTFRVEIDGEFLNFYEGDYLCGPCMEVVYQYDVKECKGCGETFLSDVKDYCDTCQEKAGQTKF